MIENLRKIVIVSILVSFVGSFVQNPVYAQYSLLLMPKPGERVNLSSGFTPAHLKGIVTNPKNALQFDFIIHKGDSPLTDVQKREEYTKLMKYFLASLAIPDEDQWVNLSPYEKDRIIKDNFGKTEMGRDLLAQDYLLKQITASLIHPQEHLGKAFWDKVYAEAKRQFNTTDIPVNTFNKVWILPDQALIYEKNNTAYIIENHLKVMMEEDYLSLQKHSGIDIKPSVPTSGVTTQIVKEIILPALEKEINEGQNFAPLRQIYSGMLLATWFKRSLKESLLAQVYVNKAKIEGVNQDSKANQEIYDQYLKAYKKGVFNFIKEDVELLTNKPILRKYFSGGTLGYSRTEVKETQDPAVGDSAMRADLPNLEYVEQVFQEKHDVDAAMKGDSAPKSSGALLRSIWNKLVEQLTVKPKGSASVETSKGAIELSRRRFLQLAGSVAVASGNDISTLASLVPEGQIVRISPESYLDLYLTTIAEKQEAYAIFDTLGQLEYWLSEVGGFSEPRSLMEVFDRIMKSPLLAELPSTEQMQAIIDFFAEDDKKSLSPGVNFERFRTIYKVVEADIDLDLIESGIREIAIEEGEGEDFEIDPEELKRLGMEQSFENLREYSRKALSILEILPKYLSEESAFSPERLKFVGFLRKYVAGGTEALKADPLFQAELRNVTIQTPNGRINELEHEQKQFERLIENRSKLLEASSSAVILQPLNQLIAHQTLEASAENPLQLIIQWPFNADEPKALLRNKNGSIIEPLRVEYVRELLLMMSKDKPLSSGEFKRITFRKPMDPEEVSYFVRNQLSSTSPDAAMKGDGESKSLIKSIWNKLVEQLTAKPKGAATAEASKGAIELSRRRFLQLAGSVAVASGNNISTLASFVPEGQVVRISAESFLDLYLTTLAKTQEAYDPFYLIEEIADLFNYREAGSILRPSFTASTPMSVFIDITKNPLFADMPNLEEMKRVVDFFKSENNPNFEKNVDRLMSIYTEMSEHHDFDELERMMRDGNKDFHISQEELDRQGMYHVFDNLYDKSREALEFIEALPDLINMRINSGDPSEQILGRLMQKYVEEGVDALQKDPFFRKEFIKFVHKEREERRIRREELKQYFEDSRKERERKFSSNAIVLQPINQLISQQTLEASAENPLQLIIQWPFNADEPKALLRNKDGSIIEPLRAEYVRELLLMMSKDKPLSSGEFKKITFSKPMDPGEVSYFVRNELSSTSPDAAMTVEQVRMEFSSFVERVRNARNLKEAVSVISEAKEHPALRINEKGKNEFFKIALPFWKRMLEILQILRKQKPEDFRRDSSEQYDELGLSQSEWKIFKGIGINSTRDFVKFKAGFIVQEYANFVKLQHYRGNFISKREQDGRIILPNFINLFEMLRNKGIYTQGRKPFKGVIDLDTHILDLPLSEQDQMFLLLSAPPQGSDNRFIDSIREIKDFTQNNKPYPFLLSTPFNRGGLQEDGRIFLVEGEYRERPGDLIISGGDLSQRRANVERVLNLIGEKIFELGFHFAWNHPILPMPNMSPFNANEKKVFDILETSSRPIGRIKLAQLFYGKDKFTADELMDLFGVVNARSQLSRHKNLRFMLPHGYSTIMNAAGKLIHKRERMALYLLDHLDEKIKAKKLRALMRAYYNETYVRDDFRSPLLRGVTHENLDKAMTAPGGIDLNSANLNLVIKRDGNGLPLPFNQQDLAQLSNLQGLDPVILGIKPLSQIPLFSHLISE